MKIKSIMPILSISALVMFIAFAMVILGPIIWQGWPALNWQYLTTAPATMGREGGIAPILVSTIWINVFAVTIAFVIGIPTALLVARSNVQRGLPFMLDILAGTPSIVFGLFGHAFFVMALGLGYSLLAGALTLSLMILPLFVRLVADALEQIPVELKLAAASLGVRESTFSFRISIPYVWPAITAALILSWTRSIGEAAALLFTAGYSMRWPESLLDSGRPLAVHIFDLSLNISGADQMAYQAAFVLILLTVGFVIFSRFCMRVLIKCQMR